MADRAVLVRDSWRWPSCRPCCCPFRAVRRSRAGQWTAAGSRASSASCLNRIDVGGLAHLRPGGRFLSAGLDRNRHQRRRGFGRGAGVPVHHRALQGLGAASGRSRCGAAEVARVRQGGHDLAGHSGQSRPAPRIRWASSWRRPPVSPFCQPQPAASRGMEPTPVHQARGGEMLWIDGNLDGFGVAFQHAEHEKREGGKDVLRQVPSHESAARQEHGLLPLPPRHVSSVRRFPARLARLAGGGARGLLCSATRAGEARAASTAARCDRCHKDLVPAGATIP